MYTIPSSVIELKKKFEAEQTFGIALDIDETLSYTNGFYFKLLLEKFGNHENLSVEEAILKYKITHNVPYWQSDEANEFLFGLRRDHDLHMEISPIPGAMTAVEEISKHIDCVCYITARPEIMRSATTEWLAKHNFPIAPIIMRPDSVDDSEMTIWKGAILEYLYPNVLGIIDDNPSFTKTVSPDYKGVLFLYDNQSLPELPIKTILCPTWRDVVTNVQTYVKEL